MKPSTSPILSWSVLGLVAAFAAASPSLGCSGDGKSKTTGSGGTGGDAGSSGTGGDAGSSGTGTGGEAGSSSTTGSAGEGGAPGCAEGDRGDLSVTISGLPDDVDADVTLGGPDGDQALDGSESLSDLETGTYDAVGAPVFDDNPLVRTMFEPGPPASACVSADSEAELEIEYTTVAPSNKLWILSDDDASVQGFGSSSLMESNDDPATVALVAPAGIDLAFEPSGNLWVVGPTVSDPHLIRYPASELGESGEPEADREVVIEDIACLPAIRAIAFDLTGQLWVSACGGSIYRLTPDDLEASGTVSPEVVIDEVTENRDIAFDEDGNLWAASDGLVVRYDENRLDMSDSDAPDAALTIRNAADSETLSADYLTFDTSGNLWITDFGGNFVAQLPSAELEGEGESTVVASSSIVLSVSALLNRPAFDGEGGLWISYSSGRVARIAPDDLLVSTNAGDPTTPDVVLSGEGIGYTSNLAFFPAPSGLPLYHSWP